MTAHAATTPPEDTRWERLLVLVGIVVLGFNLRPAAISVGPVLDEIRGSLGMSGATAGVLTTLPVLAFAAFGALAPELARRVGVHRVTLLSLLAVVGGLGVRARTDQISLFLVMSFVALAGMATANVLLPPLVRLHFPTRVGLVTALYTTSMAVGLTFASVLTVPLSEQLGSWRWGLAAWAVTAGLAALPWLGLLRHDRAITPTAHTVRLRDVARTRLGWAMATLFGLQSLQAYSIFGWFAQVYRDAGFSPAKAGVLLGVITAMSIPLSFVIPPLAARLKNQTVLILALGACYPVGYVGLILAPAGGAWAWAVLVGVGTTIFPLVLTLIGLRARTGEGTAALSGFTQSVGYLMAAVGPLGIGVLYDATGGWTVPLSVLCVVVLGQIAAGLMVARPSYIEDHLQPREKAGR